MTRFVFIRRYVSHLCQATLALMVVSAVGCSPQPPGAITIASGDRSVDQQFAAAYHSRQINGDTEFVLLDDAAKAALDGKSTDAPVRQVMRIRVLWNANRDLKADHSSSSNATLHWYVLGNTPDTASDVIEYSGTAMAVTEPDGDQTLCTIRGASMKMVARRGSLHDPIGPASFKGTIRASDNPAKTRQILARLREVILADAAHYDPSLRRPLVDRASSMAR